eukprot:TRINITY_DN809_c0_g2_i2.p1 TRINITY_DN809_c0_g2~~TRINITY_DN809_c0_g2_i2.p1  ORF type:complete len:502 (+),score=164.18 TRINITY_DN809_c0_g2_i2:94-1599(+)
MLEESTEYDEIFGNPTSNSGSNSFSSSPQVVGSSSGSAGDDIFGSTGAASKNSNSNDEDDIFSASASISPSVSNQQQQQPRTEVAAPSEPVLSSSTEVEASVPESTSTTTDSTPSTRDLTKSAEGANAASEEKDVPLGDEPVIQVTLAEWQKVGDGRSAHVSYKIHAKTNSSLYKSNSFTVERRYNDFQKLQDRLNEKHKTVIIPVLPSGNIFQSMGNKFDSQFVEKRRNELLSFLQKVGTHPKLSTSPLVIAFFENPQVLETPIPSSSTSSSSSSSSDAPTPTPAPQPAKKGFFSSIVSSVPTSLAPIQSLLPDSDRDPFFESFLTYLTNVSTFLTHLNSTLNNYNNINNSIPPAIQALNFSLPVPPTPLATPPAVPGLPIQGVSSQAETERLVEMVSEYEKEIGQVKKVINYRKEVHGNARKLELAGAKKGQEAEWTRKVDEAKKESERVGKEVRDEVERWVKWRGEEMERNVKKWMQAQRQEAQEWVKYWDRVLGETS